MQRRCRQQARPIHLQHRLQRPSHRRPLTRQRRNHPQQRRPRRSHRRPPSHRQQRLRHHRRRPRPPCLRRLHRRRSPSHPPHHPPCLRLHRRRSPTHPRHHPPCLRPLHHRRSRCHPPTPSLLRPPRRQPKQNRPRSSRPLLDSSRQPLHHRSPLVRTCPARRSCRPSSSRQTCTVHSLARSSRPTRRGSPRAGRLGSPPGTNAAKLSWCVGACAIGVHSAAHRANRAGLVGNPFALERSSAPSVWRPIARCQRSVSVRAEVVATAAQDFGGTTACCPKRNESSDNTASRMKLRSEKTNRPIARMKSTATPAPRFVWVR